MLVIPARWPSHKSYVPRRSGVQALQTRGSDEAQLKQPANTEKQQFWVGN